MTAEYSNTDRTTWELTLQDIARRRKNSKQSGIVAIHSCFTLCLWLQPRSVLSSVRVVLMSCRVNSHVVRSALQFSACRIYKSTRHFCWSGLYRSYVFRHIPLRSFAVLCGPLSLPFRKYAIKLCIIQRITFNYLMYKIMEFGVTSALALDNWEQKYCQTLGNEPNQSHHVLRGRLFSKGKLKLFNSLFHSVYLVLFQKVCFLLPICSSCVICGSYATKRNVLLWQSVRQTLASLGLLIWLVYHCLR